MFEEPATPTAGAVEEVAALLLSLHCANTNTMASARNPFRMKFVHDLVIVHILLLFYGVPYYRLHVCLETFLLERFR